MEYRVSIMEQVQETTRFIREQISFQPRVGVVLGSGLGAFADKVEDPIVIPYTEIPHFPQGHVVGHAGQLVLGSVKGVPVAVMSGRVHYYEGHSMEAVTFPTRVLTGLGVEKLLITNAAGAIPIPFAMPGGVSGLSLVFQYGISDGAAVSNVGLSNGLQLDIP